MEHLLQAQQKIVQSLKEHKGEIHSIREHQGNLIEKWQDFLSVILPIQLEVIQDYGYAPNLDGLQAFNADYLKESSESAELKEINDRKWQFLFKEAFGLTKTKQMNLETARKIIDGIAVRMTSSDFLQQLEEVVSALPGEPGILEKRQALLTILLPAHMSVMEKHGFQGEAGYIQAQHALMDHMGDEEIQEKSSYAQAVVFDKLK